MVVFKKKVFCIKKAQSVTVLFTTLSGPERIRTVTSQFVVENAAITPRAYLLYIRWIN